MAYSTAVRVWYGPESYQHAMFYHPAGHTIGTDPALPVIVYRPGGGWAGADVDDMLLSRIWWLYGLGDATSPHVDSYAVFVLQTASIGYNRTQQVGLTAWADITVYALGVYRGHGGDLWQCIAAHTSAEADDEPGVGTTWETKWREVGLNETGVRKVPDLGEITPGGLDEMVTNCQEFVGWLRRNAATYGINPDQICLAGASAGGQMAGCAAYAEDLPWARDSQVYGAARVNRYHKSQPNALLLSISPVDLTLATEFGLLNGLWGESKTTDQWLATPAAEKRAMSPVHVLKRTGLAVPTCLDYLGQGSHTPATAFTGLATATPYHHPDNGWRMLQALNAAPSTGLGQSGHMFLDDASAGVYRYYTTFSDAAPTTAGTSADPRVAASIILTWLNGAM